MKSDELRSKLQELQELALRENIDINADIDRLAEKLAGGDDTAWRRVELARHQDRPTTLKYLDLMSERFVELHGDRAFGDDRAIVTGLATLEDRRFLLVAHRKGRTTKERLECNFGCAHPEGYRKALRKMKLAEKMGLPIVSLVNTPGAYPGIGAEERGQAMAIAENILEMFKLRVPILVCV
ncbi:MAG: acetyl-CoA carboxylase carboxyl transferase subunit alpha, partial [Spirochaetales bacterium]|nr:acetyl-CoA carboxylase carboxyl transferase subunit alpha [Spirochaetales bacterium]